MKFMIDLERIGDLVSSFGGCAQAIGARIEMDDVKDLIHMATVLEQMLADIHDAFSPRDLDRVISVLRADAVIDRIRNLIFIRHVENKEGTAGPEGIHVLFMAQALERAGDHTKNLAEEVCHLVTGADRAPRAAFQEQVRRTDVSRVAARPAARRVARAETLFAASPGQNRREFSPHIHVFVTVVVTRGTY